MSERKLNFFAGPSVLPEEVLAELKDQIGEYQDNGFSMIEASHRGPAFDTMYHECLDLFRELLGIPENYSVFFLGGGATLQFSMIPMNFLGAGQTADYLKTGTWSNGACSDAQKLGNVKVLFDGKDSNYSTLPAPESITPDADAAYLHLCSNETIGGIEWQGWPETGDVPLIADMSSDILSRPVPVEKFAMIYGGVQKNLGPAGATFVILRDDMLERSPANLTSYLNYNTHAKKDGLFNTPPVFSIWAVKLVLEWVKAHGGAQGMAERATRKANLLYNAIDSLDSVFYSPVDARYRSKMNVVFRLRDEELEKQFLKETAAMGMLGLKGHRSVGGCRASIYNSLPEESVAVLADYMKEFARKNG
jgi:phosphoserine aminotransferase